MRSFAAVCREQAPDWVAFGQVDVAATPRIAPKSDIYLPNPGAAALLASDERRGVGIRLNGEPPKNVYILDGFAGKNVYLCPSRLVGVATLALSRTAPERTNGSRSRRCAK